MENWKLSVDSARRFSPFLWDVKSYNEEVNIPVAIVSLAPLLSSSQASLVCLNSWDFPAQVTAGLSYFLPGK